MPRSLPAFAALFLAWTGACAQPLTGASLFGSLPEPPTEASAPRPVHDPANPAASLLQSAREALAPLPADARGKPDWVRALRSGTIDPRADVPGKGAIQTLELDVLMKNTAQMPFVLFPHRAHTEWLACTNCHEQPFASRIGANPTTMSKILQGESCGSCHRTVAFPAMYTCERCHSVPQPGQQRWW